MDGLVVMPKPDWISWEEITDILHDAHRSTVADGMNYLASYQDVDDTIRRVGDGICYVAIINDKAVGTMTVKRHVPKRKWYNKKSYASFSMIGVLSNYKRMGVLSSLSTVAERWVTEENLNTIVVDAAVQNEAIQRAKLKNGFKYVDFISKRNTNYYSVVMVKWLNGSPYSDIYCSQKFLKAKIKCKLIYARSGSFRFYIKLIKIALELIRGMNRR